MNLLAKYIFRNISQIGTMVILLMLIAITLSGEIYETPLKASAEEPISAMRTTAVMFVLVITFISSIITSFWDKVNYNLLTNKSKGIGIILSLVILTFPIVIIDFSQVIYLIIVIPIIWFMHTHKQ